MWAFWLAAGCVGLVVMFMAVKRLLILAMDVIAGWFTGAL